MANPAPPVKLKSHTSPEVSQQRIKIARDAIGDEFIALVKGMAKMTPEETDKALTSLKVCIARYDALKELHGTLWNPDGTPVAKPETASV